VNHNVFLKHHVDNLLLLNLNFNKRNISFFFYLEVIGELIFAVLLKHNKA
jgi:hypothetical protein